jgi:hypothetical protein
MYIKTSLSMLACAAVAAAQTTTVPNSGLTPAQVCDHFIISAFSYQHKDKD